MTPIPPKKLRMTLRRFLSNVEEVELKLGGKNIGVRRLSRVVFHGLG